MRMHRLIGVAVVLAASAGTFAADIEMQPGVKLKAGDEVIDGGKDTVGHLVPTVVDWNGDGKKDLIVGSFSGNPGNVMLYLNIGTDAEPKLDKGRVLEAGGVPIKLTGG